MGEPAETAHTGASRSRALRMLGIVVLVEALLLLVVAGYLGIGLLRWQATDGLAGAFELVLALLLSSGLLACGWHLGAGRRWARAPTLTWQLLQAAVGVPAIDGRHWWIGAFLVAMSAIVVVGLFRPDVVAATQR